MPAFWISVDNFLEHSAMPVADRAEIVSLLPYLQNAGLQANYEGWKPELDGILQYLMHMQSVEKN